MSEIADFLTRFRPGGPWLLTAIVPDGMTSTRTFTDADAAERWALDENAAGRNLYFSVNQTTRALDKKATKADIARVEFLHVDLDPRAGEDLASERERIRKRLNGSLAADGIPPPSFIIDSGGGYQAFWRLAEPIELDGDPAKIEDAERYNIELARKLGGGATHNIDRIMRLPGGGLTNWPTAKKREKGREPAPTKLYGWPAVEPYSLAAFKQAPAARADAPASRKAPSATQKRGPVPAGPYGVDELDAWATANGKTLPDTALAALVHGRDADPDKYPSRSEAAWAVCCGLTRAGVPDELIVAALLDKNNGGAAHVLAQQKPTAYAHMQVAKARAEVEKQASLRWDRTNKAGEPLPSYWNTRVALQLMGVECRYDKFRDRHLVGAHELQEFAGEFSDHAERILRDEIFRRFCFDPGELNTNKAVMSLCTENRFDSLLDHLESLPVWDGVPRLDSWLIDYCGADASPYVREAGATWLVAALVRAYEPGTKFDYMPVLLGGQGVGKSTALRIIAGDDFFSDASFLGARDAREVLEVTRGIWILECAELDGMGKRDVSALKATIARQTDTGRPAYARCAVTVPRRYVVAGTTNEERFLLDPTENRRFWPIAVGLIDLEGLRAVRDQLIAEALARYRSGDYRLTLFGDAATGAKEAQAERRVVDDGYVERLENLGPTGKRDGRWIVTNEAVYRHLDIPIKDRCGAVPRKVREAMTALGWVIVKGSVRVAGEKQRIYEWPGDDKPGSETPF
ncbi:VapE domain-containing protein [Stenotrophomonas muris]|uniref:VapE domain-containing protein n=1 Tax=Stenotrophomonas muris TaxID=2963283 RepID=UPI002E79048D|nr:VapE domain-containing protein [Stenotrophomonas muris]